MAHKAVLLTLHDICDCLPLSGVRLESGTTLDKLDRIERHLQLIVSLSIEHSQPECGVGP
ncbi:hypothetical protein Q4555_15655 [Octadecabacter sp. 1_MG-2023]|uniref:hypothetical protein n=1 Tax=Octadecabacter sp. B2R22 TaxID=2841570 RepID=UPI001C0A3476|nr:hypothetical protein [Octadecabacter sp. B2R22]MDO6736114.1 hypothetical protein [Octadecabacter sp. 1_MG-2023]